MDRRSFMKSMGAAALLPVMPASSFAMAATPVPAVSAHTFQWAEMIVRAHNKCNLGLLQRSLQINEATASILKSQLIEKGIVSAQANAYGIHTATKPLYESAFMNVCEPAKSAAQRISGKGEQSLPKSESPEETVTENKLEAEQEISEESEENQNFTEIHEETDSSEHDGKIAPGG